MLVSDSGSGDMFHALIIIEMFGISGIGKRALGNN